VKSPWRSKNDQNCVTPLLENPDGIVPAATAREHVQEPSPVAAADISIRADEDIRDKYHLGDIIGSGSFGQVRKAVLKQDPTQVRAVKVIERGNDDGAWTNEAMSESEVKLLQQMDHPNIIRFHDFYEDIGFLYVVMEMCSGGEVFTKVVELKQFSEKNAAFMGQQMLSAIAHLHLMRVVHRDIKAENFMFLEPDIKSQIKMIDFGMATKCPEDTYLTDLCGSPHYLAPEVIGQKYNNRADLWAFGVLMYLLMYGHYPYDAKHPRDIMVKILTCPIAWQTKAKLSEKCLHFLKSLLEPHPSKRITAIQAIQHAWIVDGSPVEQPEEALPMEVVRNAARKVTQTRKPVDPKINEMRNQRLREIEADWSKGIRHGQRLGPAPIEDYMLRPEFVRRDNKTTTAPARQSPGIPSAVNDEQLLPATQAETTEVNSAAKLLQDHWNKNSDKTKEDIETQTAAPRDPRDGAAAKNVRSKKRMKTVQNYQITAAEEEGLIQLYQKHKEKMQENLASDPEESPAAGDAVEQQPVPEQQSKPPPSSSHLS